jgi:hypothetical protein
MPSGPCQTSVSVRVDAPHVPSEPNNVIHQLAVGEPSAIAEIVERAQLSDDVTTLVAASLFAVDATDLLERATAFAHTTRDRQVVAIAIAHLAGDVELVDALARDHLTDHPSSVLVAWITTRTNPNSTTRKDRT